MFKMVTIKFGVDKPEDAHGALLQYGYVQHEKFYTFVHPEFNLCRFRLVAGITLQKLMISVEELNVIAV